MSLIVSVIGYAHKVCCERVITFVPQTTMEGRIMCSQVGEQISLEICVSRVGETHVTKDMCFLGRGPHITRDMTVFPG